MNVTEWGSWKEKLEGRKEGGEQCYVRVVLGLNQFVMR